ncbi:MAG: hypothetical protein ABL956_01865 [Hyphomonadaceae bacterium]
MGRFGQALALAGISGLTTALAACGSGTVNAAAPELVAAMRAVYPEADRTTGAVRVPAAADDPAKVEHPVLIIQGEGDHSYLVTVREQADACDTCAASLSVFYLDNARGMPALARAHRDIDQPASWRIAGGITPVALRGDPGIAETSAATAQGCTESAVTVFRFDAAGPIKLLDDAPLGVSFANVDVVGNIIKPYVADADFAITYLGNSNSAPVDATVMWKIENEALIQASGFIPDEVTAGC